MTDRKGQQPQPPTPVADDAHATASELHARAAQDYQQAAPGRAQRATTNSTPRPNTSGPLHIDADQL